MAVNSEARYIRIFGQMIKSTNISNPTLQKIFINAEKSLIKNQVESCLNCEWDDSYSDWGDYSDSW